MNCDHCGGEVHFNAAGGYDCPACESKRKEVEVTRTIREDENKQLGSLRFLKTRNSYEMRRINSEKQLEQLFDWHAEPGAAYHIISMGDIDSLTFLKWILRQQPLDYLIASTWCMALTDCEEIDKLVSRQIIKRADFYVGEIFQKTYSAEYTELARIVRTCQGRVGIFRNHAKIFTGRGPRFDFAIESSANINTNPRTEQTTITIDTPLFLFYKEFFDGIKSYNRDFDSWTPWKI